MIRHGALLVLLSALGAAAACGGSPEPSEEDARKKSGEPAAEAAPTDVFDAAEIRSYMAQLAPMLVSRELEPGELDEIDKGRFGAVVPMLTKWTHDAAFPRVARRLYSQKLSVSGTRDGIDFDLPGNLAEYVVREELPLTTVLTADYCIDAAGNKRECDSGAPYKAGVLGTRAYMASRASRFNLTRASTMMGTFACQVYPMKSEYEPRIDRTRLIPMFQSDQEIDEVTGKPKATFGNGAACYSCHGQFGPHAQLFVRFDETGMYRPTATGIQDAKGELGRSTSGLFASHLKEAVEAKEEKSQMLGKPVANLQEAARVLAEDAAFVPCQARNVLSYALRLPADAVIVPEVVQEIALHARAKGEPTFGTLVIETFSHPRVIAAVVGGLGSSGAEKTP